MMRGRAGRHLGGDEGGGALNGGRAAGARPALVMCVLQWHAAIRSLARERCGEVPMATYAAEQVAPPTRGQAACAGIPILASKITVPGVPGWTVPRPRITKLIAEGTRWCPLTVVTGPPGAGKTMALALWAAAEAGPVAWVSLDDYDNQPGVFWAYVAVALRRSGAAVPGALSTAARGAGGRPCVPAAARVGAGG